MTFKYYIQLGEPFCNPDGTVYRYCYPGSSQCHDALNIPVMSQRVPHPQYVQQYTVDQPLIATENSSDKVESSCQVVPVTECSTEQGGNFSGEHSMGPFQQHFRQTMLTQQQSCVIVRRNINI